MVGTLSQSDYWWGPSANQITCACTGAACPGVVRAGAACAGVVRAGVVGTLSQSDYTRVAHTGVVGTLSQSDYTGVACTGVAHARACRGCACRGGGDT